MAQSAKRPENTAYDEVVYGSSVHQNLEMGSLSRIHAAHPRSPNALPTPKTCWGGLTSKAVKPRPRGSGNTRSASKSPSAVTAIRRAAPCLSPESQKDSAHTFEAKVLLSSSVLKTLLAKTFGRNTSTRPPSSNTPLPTALMSEIATALTFRELEFDAEAKRRSNLGNLHIRFHSAIQV